MKFLILLALLQTAPSLAKEQSPKGLLPELRIDSTNEEENQKKALRSEILITKTENQAIATLNNILKKRKGTPEEPELWNRLAELYMRRAKSGRFFDLSRNSNEAVKFAPPEALNETAVKNLKLAISIYNKIESEFPKFAEMDSVLFNAAFANQQINQKKLAEGLYLKLAQRFAKSPLLPDAHLALGEIKYEGQNFQGALEHFLIVQKFPNSRVYSYGLYKSAWAYYNLHQSDQAIEKLIDVVKYHDPRNQTKNRHISHNLRTEAIRDLTIFFEETSSPDKALEFFAQFTTTEELGDAVIVLGQIYDSHARHKEMNVFLNDFIKSAPTSAQRVKAHTLLISANEALRNRKEVLSQLKQLDQICKKESTWAVENTKLFDEACNFDFAKANVEVAKKWWDLWLKNKATPNSFSQELADLTQQAFKIHLDREDPLHPDSKSRYAYAELLFQLEDFRNASAQYALAADRTTDTVLKHDGDYAALVSLEKASAKKTDRSDADSLLQLSQKYLEHNPKGEHVTQVKFKIGFIAYELKNFDEAEKWLVPLAQDEKSGEFKRKSEDLVLDILNARKDYKRIQEFAKDIAGQSKDEERKSSLAKIMQEAEYTEIQDFAKSSEKFLAAQKLHSFYREHKNTTLAKDALWQALSLAYASGRSVDGAEMALEYGLAYPGETKSIDALKDAAQAQTQSGHLTAAAKTMELIVQRSAGRSEKDVSTYTDAAAELYTLEGNKKLAVSSFLKLANDSSNKENQAKLFAKALTTLKGEENTDEYQRIENKLLALGQEPYFSEIRLKRVQALWTSKKATEAFNAAKTLVATDKGIPEEVRAKARLIQAHVLEIEFLQQSTKTSVEKLSLILSLKTEKLDKAQTAYLTAAKISKDPNVQLEALQGLNRIYKNYVETVGHPIIKTDLKPDEKKALSEELAKLVNPIAEKMQDTSKRLTALAKDTKATRSEEIDFANLPAEDSVKARIKNPSDEKLQAFLPVLTEGSQELSAIRHSPTKLDKCGFEEKDKALSLAALATKTNICLTQNNLPLAEKLASQISRNAPKSPLGTYYMSIIADLKGQLDKALWLIELSQKKQEDASAANYQKARVLYKLKDFAGANRYFIKAYDQKLAASEIYLMHGLVSFAEGDCYSVVDDFAHFDAKTVSDFAVGAAYAECHAQKGELDRALALIKSQLQIFAGNLEVLLESAYIHEIYKSDSAATIAAYEAAAKVANQPEIKDWLQRKLNYLKGSKQQVSMNN